MESITSVSVNKSSPPPRYNDEFENACTVVRTSARELVHSLPPETVARLSEAYAQLCVARERYEHAKQAARKMVADALTRI